MKRVLALLLLLVLAACQSQDRIDWKEARAHVGETKTVCGVIAAAGTSNASERVRFRSLVFGDKSGEPLGSVETRIRNVEATVIVIPEEFASRFKSLPALVDERFCAHGLIDRDGDGNTVVHIGDPSQLSPF